jgi:ankyrin repeat protein
VSSSEATQALYQPLKDLLRGFAHSDSSSESGYLQHADNCLAAGANINGRFGRQRQTLLGSLAELDMLAAFRWALEKGADPNAVDGAGANALGIALARRRGYRESKHKAVSYLESWLQASGDPEALHKDLGGCFQTALRLSAKLFEPDCVRLLLRSGARADSVDETGRTALNLYAARAVDWFSDRISGVNGFVHLLAIVDDLISAMVPRGRRSAINSLARSAAGYSNLPLLIHLVKKHGAKTGPEYPGAPSPLHEAARVNYSTELTSSLVAFLLEQGAPVDAFDQNGYTPLQLAAKAGALETVRLLVQAGADAKAVGTKGSAITVARRANELATVAFLISHGATGRALQAAARMAAPGP